MDKENLFHRSVLLSIAVISGIVVLVTIYDAVVLGVYYKYHFFVSLILITFLKVLSSYEPLKQLKAKHLKWVIRININLGMLISCVCYLCLPAIGKDNILSSDIILRPIKNNVWEVKFDLDSMQLLRVYELAGFEDEELEDQIYSLKLYYKGGFNSNRKMDGIGMIKWQNGNFFFGNFKNGVRKSGLYFFNDGFVKISYTNYYKQDSAYFDYYHTIYYDTDGYCFHGKTTKGSKEGWGYLYFPNGQRKYNLYKNDKCIMCYDLIPKNTFVGYINKITNRGYGRYYYAQGGYYQGNFKNGMFHGKGALISNKLDTIICRTWNMEHPDSVYKMKYPENIKIKLKSITPKTKQIQDSLYNNKLKKKRIEEENRMTEKMNAEKARKDFSAFYKPTEQEISLRKKIGIDKTYKFIPVPDANNRKIIKYTGDLLLGKYPHGKGRAEYENGDIYDGEWINGLREGYGEAYYFGGDTYKGKWKAGKRTGKGYYKNVDEYTIKGSFLNGYPHGVAIMYYRNSRIFNGKWDNGRPLIKEDD